MNFSTAEYLSWYIPRIRGDHPAANLHASGMPAIDPADYPVAPYDPWHVRSQFEAELAQWLGLTPPEVLATAGATGGTLLALLTLVPPQGDVLVEQPIYEPMLRQAERTAHVRRLVRHDHEGWSLPPAQVARQLAPTTRLVMITEPHNPSGCFAPREDVEELAERTQRQGTILLINEVYRGYSGRPSYHGLRPNVVVVSSLSKLCGTYWARLGWLSGAPETIQSLRQGQLNASMGSSPAAALGRALLPRADALRQEAQKVAAQGHALVHQWVEAQQHMAWCAPQGPGFGCLRLPAGVDDQKLVEDLYTEEAVLVIPGTLFEAPGTIRLSWLQAGDQLAPSLEAISRSLARLAP